MPDSSKAVFLSYASQDAEVAKRICEALRAAGIEVWFDQSELRGGDAWDALIRKRIKECALFVPVITSTTNARAEGYFRLEWKLAVDRSHLMADDQPFLFPIVVGDVNDATARVPDKFRDVQWTRLRLDETPAELAVRVMRLLADGGTSSRESGSEASRELGPPGSRRRERAAWMRTIGMIGGIAIGLIYAIRPLLQSGGHSEDKPAVAAPSAGASAPQISEARKLTERARAMSIDKYDSSIDDFTAAEGLVKKALELDSNDADIWAVSSLLNFGFNSRGFERTPARNAAARAHAERALKLAPDSTEALFALGRWQRDNEEPALAEATLLKVLARNPDHSGALHNLGYLYDRMDRLDEAAALYVREARNPAAAPLAGFTEYLMYFRRARFPEADAAVRKSIAAEPSANSQSGLALLLLTWKGDPEAAAAAVATGPATIRREHRPIWITALVHLCRRKPDAALRVLERLSDEYILDNMYSGPKDYFVGLAHAQAGREAAARVAWESGLAVVDQRLRNTPADYQLRLARGELLAWLGRETEALAEVRTLEQLAFGEHSWIYRPARIYAALGRADDALKIIEQQLAFTREHRNLGWPLTSALLRVDPRWDKIRGDPRFQALCAEPEAPTVAVPVPLSEGLQLAARAQALYLKVGFTRDDLAPAEDFARRATEKEPDSATAWGVRAGVQAAWLFRNWDKSEKRRQDAQAFANRALALDPNEPEALLALGHLLRELGAREQAIAHFRRALAANPQHVRLARALGYTLSGSNRDEEARVVLLEALQRAPRDPLLRYELALSYCSYGAGGAHPANLTAALEHLEAALAIQPFGSALVLKAALLGGWRGDLPAMRATLDQVEKLPLAERSEDRVVCVAMWAGLLERRPDRVEAAAALTARNYFDDGVMPLHPKAWSLALAHRQAGKENLARADWQAAEAVLRARLKDEPGNLFYTAELAITLAWLGRREEAGQLISEVEPVWLEGRSVYQAPRLLALYFAAVGDAARAAPYLRGDLDGNVFTTRHVVPLDPMWDKLRGQPEFEALFIEPKTETPAARPVAAPPAVDPKSIAVLPFANLSTDKENEFFTDGVHDDVITNLAKIRDLKVISRTSTLAYRDTASRNLKKIAAELGVATVLEGSVRRIGNKVHMNAQLIDARTDAHLWADTFDGDASDIFALQASLAQKIAAQLKATLTPDEKTLIERRPTENLEAYEFYLRGRVLEERLTQNSRIETYDEAIRAYQQAVALDPAFALAYARLARLHGTVYWFGYLDPSPARKAQVEAVVAAAQRHAPDAPETHFARGVMEYFVNTDWERALAEYRLAEAGLPNDIQLQYLIAFTFRRLGRWAEALDYMERSLSRGPRELYVATQIGSYYRALRRYDAAIGAGQRCVALFPQDSVARTILVLAQFEKDNDLPAYQQALASIPPSENDPHGLQAAYQRALLAGDLAAADRALADPRLTGITDPWVAVLAEPVSFHRARVAWLRGDAAAAKRFGEEAIADFNRRAWTPRQRLYVAVAVCEAQAYAGRADVVLRDLPAALVAVQRHDAYGSRVCYEYAGQAQLVLGRRDEALAMLRPLMTGPSFKSPNSLRIDPFWSRLKDDPRFEEILKSARPL